MPRVDRMPEHFAIPGLPARPLTVDIEVGRLIQSAISQEIYGENEPLDLTLLESISRDGILEPLAVVRTKTGAFELVSGHRRLVCARELGLKAVPCVVRKFASEIEKHCAIVEYNLHRVKTFSQVMREADLLEGDALRTARLRRLAGLRNQREPILSIHDAPPGAVPLERRKLDGRADSALAATLGLGGKDRYRQARAIWKHAQSGDTRALANVARLDRRELTIHAAYKNLRRRDRFTSGFKPTPYDVWSFRHDGAFGIPHPGSIPSGIVAHTLHYFTSPGDLVVDPFAGGGTVIDVCESMGRKCLAYDLVPTRADIRERDFRQGFAQETRSCRLVFADPPYYSMLKSQYPEGSVSHTNLIEWQAFLKRLAQAAFDILCPGGCVALLLANQTEKDLPAGYGYLDHAFFGLSALLESGFQPERRVSCPMSGNYLPQDVARARRDGRMLGQTRDLVVARKPLRS